MEKRYFYKQAYLDKIEIFMYIGGTLTETDIISSYYLDGYISRLENKGFTFGYPPEEVEYLRECCEDAKKAYEDAQRNMINVKGFEL